MIKSNIIRLKFIILGSFAVGKTSILSRFVSDEFNADYLPTIGVNIKSKSIVADNKDVNLVIWDIADIVTYKTIPASYGKGTNGILLVFDLTRPESLERLIEEKEGFYKQNPNIPAIVLGNKADLIDEKELEKIKANSPIKIDFITSAKFGDNIAEAFKKLTLSHLNSSQ